MRVLELPTGVGLGLRYSFAEDLLRNEVKPDWVEIAPENWMGRGGFFRKTLFSIRRDRPVVCHGLSLSLGSPDPLNKDFLRKLKEFMDAFEIAVYSEHLSFSSMEGSYLHDLFPIPFTEEMVLHVSKRILEVQELLDRPLIVENISYYYQYPSDMEEWEFINAVLDEGQAYLLLDVNNVYVNSINHGYDPYRFINNLDLSKVAYIHVAGHERFEKFLIDTHGSPVMDEVYKLLRVVLERTGEVPVLLERDNNIPAYEELIDELNTVRGVCKSVRI